MQGDGEIIPPSGTLPLTLEERRTAQFYDWERRGRGWQIWDFPVELEPPFRPFFYHYAEPGPAVDDARKPTALSSFVDTILGRRAAPPQPPPFVEERESDPEPYYDDDPLIEFQVHVLTTEEFFAFVETLEAHAAGREEKVLGYKVKVDYQPVAEGEQKARKQAISQVILGALKKLKGDRK
jgi:hypothetical protein